MSNLNFIQSNIATLSADGFTRLQITDMLAIAGVTKLDVVGDIVLACVDSLHKYQQKCLPGAPIVVLGRDAWPLYPLLLKRGVNAQYFLFSRLQTGDEGTITQWHKEVPKKSLVVDTGFAGSILMYIKNIDPDCAGGALISSSGYFPQFMEPLETNGHYYSPSRMVALIERLPKSIGRCVAINSQGIARCPQDTRDSDELGETWQPEKIRLFNVALCLKLGLDYNLWANFTGITPEQRFPRLLHEQYKFVKDGR